MTEHRPGFLIVNPRSGDGGVDKLLEAARARGIDTHVLRIGDDAAELARGSDATAIGMAGGDGSLAEVAAVAAARDLPFVCVPFGTRNHFARDAGLDRDDPIGCLAAFEDRVERRVDLGFAGDRPFLNNVSLGLYATLVQRRERHRRRSDAFARLRALATLTSHRRVPLLLDGERLRADVLLVASNAYAIEALSLGERERLDEGRLHAYTAGLLPSTWQERAGERFEVDSPRERLRVAIDGEPAELPTPIAFRIEPSALRVLLPRG